MRNSNKNPACYLFFRRDTSSATLLRNTIRTHRSSAQTDKRRAVNAPAIFLNTYRQTRCSPNSTNKGRCLKKMTYSSISSHAKPRPRVTSSVLIIKIESIEVSDLIISPRAPCWTVFYQLSNTPDHRNRDPIFHGIVRLWIGPGFSNWNSVVKFLSSLTTLNVWIINVIAKTVARPAV